MTGHYIYGWLQVGEKFDLNGDKDFRDLDSVTRKYHPHTHLIENWKNNRLYLAAKNLNIGGLEEVPGCGYFSKLNDSLLMSCPENHAGHSRWRLVKAFSGKHGIKQMNAEAVKQCDTHNDCSCINSGGNKQEYVADLSGGVLDWVKELFKQNKDNIYRPS